MRSPLLLTALILSAPLAHAGGLKPFIEKGDAVKTGDALHRAVALVQFASGAWCSASFLSARTLLTAGHCAEKQRASNLRVRALSPQGAWEERPVQSLALHPEFQHYKNAADEHIFRSDLAVLQLAAPFSFAVRAVRLTEVSGAMARGEWGPVTDAGYGFSRGKTGGKVLRRGSMAAHVSRVHQFEDREGLEQFKNASDQNACPGDSGGPVLLGPVPELRVIGVHSMADGCTAESKLTYSELVWPARAWIRAQVR